MELAAYFWLLGSAPVPAGLRPPGSSPAPAPGIARAAEEGVQCTCPFGVRTGESREKLVLGGFVVLVENGSGRASSLKLFSGVQKKIEPPSRLFVGWDSQISVQSPPSN